MLKFSAYYETAKFTGDQSDWLGNLEWGGVWNKGTDYTYFSERHTSFSVAAGHAGVSLLIYARLTN